MKALALVALLISLAVPALVQAQQPDTARIQFVDPPDDMYVDLIVTATGWAKGSIARSLGVLQSADATDLLRRAITEATQRHALRPIELKDYVAVCRTRQASRSAPSERTCSMKGAEAVMQFISAKVAGDSGFVGISVTRVPKNSTRPESFHYCIALARKDGKWEAHQNETKIDAERCPRGWG